MTSGLERRRIDFVAGRKAAAAASDHDACPPGLVPLNGAASNGRPAQRRPERSARDGAEDGHARAEGEGEEEEEDGAVTEIDLEWKEIRKVGAGLHNLGNTCFLNSVLQCLTHTAPLASVALAGGSFPPGALHDLLRHIQQALTSSGGVLAPTQLIRGLRQTSKQFRHGRQEDAHEYARCLLEACGRHRGERRLWGPADTKRIVDNIFGGRLCSQVKCLNGGCRHVSNTFDPFLDLSLEISRASTLAKALQRFTAVETLDGENKYKCEACRAHVKASKRFWIEGAPNALALQLKRFEYGAYGRKVDKHVKFPVALDLTPYMRAPGRRRYEYGLYAVLVHSGHSTHSGHYYSFVKAPSGVWYLMDDGRVRQVGEQQVLDQRAYMLFYMRKAPPRGARAAGPVPEPAGGPGGAEASEGEGEEEEETSDEEAETAALVARSTPRSARVAGPQAEDEDPSPGRGARGRSAFHLRRMVTRFIRRMRELRRGHRVDRVMMSPIQKRRSMRIELKNLVLRRSDPLYIMGDGTRGVLGTRERLEFEGGAAARRPRASPAPSARGGGASDDGAEDGGTTSGSDEDDRAAPVDAAVGGAAVGGAAVGGAAVGGAARLRSMVGAAGSGGGHTARVLDAGQWEDADVRVRDRATKLKRASAPKIKRIDEWYVPHRGLDRDGARARVFPSDECERGTRAGTRSTTAARSAR